MRMAISHAATRDMTQGYPVFSTFDIPTVQGFHYDIPHDIDGKFWNSLRSSPFHGRASYFLDFDFLSHSSRHYGCCRSLVSFMSQSRSIRSRIYLISEDHNLIDRSYLRLANILVTPFHTLEHCDGFFQRLLDFSLYGEIVNDPDTLRLLDKRLIWPSRKLRKLLK